MPEIWTSARESFNVTSFVSKMEMCDGKKSLSRDSWHLWWDARDSNESIRSLSSWWFVQGLTLFFLFTFFFQICLWKNLKVFLCRGFSGCQEMPQILERSQLHVGGSFHLFLFVFFWPTLPTFLCSSAENSVRDAAKRFSGCRRGCWRFQTVSTAEVRVWPKGRRNDWRRH